MTGTRALRRAIVDACRRLDARGLVAGQDGNVSARLPGAPDRILITPAGATKAELRPGDLVELGLESSETSGQGRASSEVGMHLRIYHRRPDVGAVVHAHPPVATAFAVAGEGLGAPVLPEIVFQLGWVPLVPYATPGTNEVADRLEPFLATHDAFLLANHGATTIGPTLRVAQQRMESLEHAARILLAARLLGRVTELTPDQVQALAAARRLAGVPGPFPDFPPSVPPRSGGRRPE